MTDEQFFQIAVRDFEYTPKQAELLVRFVSRRPHTHTADQITNLAKSVTEIVEEVLDEEID